MMGNNQNLFFSPEEKGRAWNESDVRRAVYSRRKPDD